MSHLKSAVIMAGGTGGHIFPGLAVAESLLSDGWSVRWFGNPNGMEATLVAKHDISMSPLYFKGVRGKGLLRWLSFPVSLIFETIRAISYLVKERPSCVVSMGGYIALPGGLAAFLLRIPLIVHEQNAVAGMVNKLLAYLAKVRCVAFPNALKQSILTGNPVRRSLTEIQKPDIRYTTRTGPITLLVVGGSLGSQILNTVVPMALAMPGMPTFKVIHQAGKQHLEQLRSHYNQHHIQASIVDFIDDMATAYSEADLILSRSGAMTVSEITAVGIASILVPYPHAVDDHQTVNAQFLLKHKAAILIKQPDFTAQSLSTYLQELDRQRLSIMAMSAYQLGKPKACEEIVQVCKQLIGSD